MASFKVLLFLKISLVPKLRLVGLYFKFAPTFGDNDKTFECVPVSLGSQSLRGQQVDINLSEHTDAITCDYLPWANFYFYSFLIYNVIDTDFQRASVIDYFHFIFKTLGWPFVFYKLVNDISYKYTIHPWETTEGMDEQEKLTQLEYRWIQTVLLLVFLTIK